MELNHYITNIQFRENNKVAYIFGKIDGTSFEIQLWPSVMLQLFLIDYYNVYKPTNPNNVDERLEKSKKIHALEHMVQNLIDKEISSL